MLPLVEILDPRGSVRLTEKPWQICTVKHAIKVLRKDKVSVKPTTSEGNGFELG